MIPSEDQSIRIVDKPGTGRCLIAGRDIKPLEIIFKDKPAVIAPNITDEIFCCMCLKRLENSSSVCQRCLFPICQDVCSSSEKHLEECRYLQMVSEKIKDDKRCPESQAAILAVVRTLIVRNHGGSSWNDIDKLMSHKDERKKTTTEWNAFQTTVVDPIVEALGVEFDISEEVVQDVIGKLNINCASFSFSKERILGRGLYPLLSLASHSCVANARYQVNPDEDFSVVLRAKREIFEGEEITIAYVPPTQGQPYRQLELYNEWYFECECSRCMDTTEFGTFFSALKCKECSEGLILPENIHVGSTWRCRFCNAPYATEMIMSILESIENQLKEIAVSSSVKQLETFIRKNLSKLHMKHYLILSAQRQIIEILTRESKITKDVCKKIIKYCKSYMCVMSRLDTGYSGWKGYILKHHNYAQLNLLKLLLQDKNIDRNEFSVKSEEVWCSMKEVENCDILCSRHIAKNS